MIHYKIWNAMGPEPHGHHGGWTCYDGVTPGAAAFDFAAAGCDFEEAINASGVYRVRELPSRKLWEVRIDIETEELEDEQGGKP